MCERARSELDEWYLQLPEYSRASIGTRFRNASLGHHRGALLELYLHESFRRLGFEIDLDVGRENAACPRPDFLLTNHETAFYAEAAAALGPDLLGDRRKRPAVAALYDAINQVRAPAFFVGVDVEACGTRTPGKRKVIKPIEDWLAALDPDQVLTDHGRGQGLPERKLQFDDWIVVMTAIPVSPEHRGKVDHRVLGTQLEGVAEIDDARTLRSKLKSKAASRYVDHDRAYLVAVLCAGDFVDDRDILDALLGSTAVQFNRRTGESGFVREPDGFWHGPKGPQNTAVSAVLTVPRLSWWAITTAEPTVWVNPWANQSLCSLPWRTQQIKRDGNVETTKVARTPAKLLTLPDGWPTQAPNDHALS
jgi:hypothetical protein